MSFFQPLLAVKWRLQRLISQAMEGDPTAIAIVAAVVVVIIGFVVVKTRRRW